MSIYLDSLWSVLFVGKKTSDLPEQSNSPRERARHLTANPMRVAQASPTGLAGVLFLHFVDRVEKKLISEVDPISTSDDAKRIF